MRHTTESASPSPRIPAPTNSFTFIPEDSMANGPFQDTASSPPSSSNTGGPKFRPYASSNHHVTKGRYITSNDPRGYIPVYEYPLNGQWIMMDIDDGYILWTGIWKALGNSKADIVKMIDSQPDLAAQIRRVRGGYLKIQGTWMPYEVALRLSRRVAWTIREDLVPLFGPTFPSTCLSPEQPGYGQVVASGPGRRRTRKSNAIQASTATSNLSNSAASASMHQGWTVFTSHAQSSGQVGSPQSHSQFIPQYAPFSDFPNHPSPSPVESQACSTSKERGNVRYAPYPNPSPPLSVSVSSSTHRDIRSISPLSPSQQHPHPQIVLPPIGRESVSTLLNGGASYALPPISALEDLRGVDASDSAAVLRRLKSPDQPGDYPRRLSTPGVSSSSRSSSSKFSSLSWPPPQYHSIQPALPSIHKLPSDPSMHSHHTLRSYDSRDSIRSSRLSVSLTSDSSCAPSPISPPSPSTPATPHSAISMVSAFGRETMSKDPRQEYHYFHPSSDHSRVSLPFDSRRGSYGSESLSRRSSESSEMHLDHGHRPHRPW